MAALIALQLRLCWRGLPQMLRVFWIILAVMLLSYLSKKSSGLDNLYPMLAAPMMMILMGALMVIGSSEPLIWQVPIRRSARVWARGVLLALSGAFAAAFVAGMHLAHGSRPPEPWPLYLANLVMTWIGGGLLLFVAGDLVRRAHVVVQAIVIIVAASPAVATIAFHVLPGLSWPALPAEAAAAIVLLMLNLHVNRDLEFTFTPTAAGKESPRDAVAEPGESCRIAVRVPSLTSALLRAQFASVLHWVFIVVWIGLSMAPLGNASIIPCAVVPPMFVTRLLEIWRPFQATPAPRGKVMAVLFLPLLGLWVLTVGLQCWSVQWSPTTLFTGSLSGFRFPMLTREVPSPELEGRLTRLPPRKVAELIHDAYRTGYGLDVPVSQILSLQNPEGSQEGWLLEVDRHWKSAVQGRILEWRLLVGAMTLAWGMLSFVSTFPGRWPRWLSGSILLIAYLLTISPLFFPGQANILSRLPAPVLAVYQIGFDRPWIAIAAFTAFAGAFLIRNYIAFKSTELAPQWGKPTA